jgi:hypothetical protein
MSCGPSMLAMIFSWPPWRAQHSISTPNNDDNHWVLKPADSMEWYDTVLAWLNRWLNDNT